MAERGRPSLYTDDLAAEINRRLANGESLRAICRDDGMPAESTVREWAADTNHPFSAQYARCRDLGLDSRADEVMDIADGDGDVARDRLKFDARRWYLSKLAPKRYGDRTVNEHTGKDGAPLVPDVTDAELTRRTALVLHLLMAKPG